jgi:hypothetical protein
VHLVGEGRSVAAERGVLAGLRAKSALVLGDCRSPHHYNFPGLERSSPCRIRGGIVP